MEIDKLKRRGWGEAKIKRWVKEKKKSLKKNEIEMQHYKQDRLAEAQEWVDFLKEVVGHKEFSRFGLLLHWYRGGPESEKIQIKDIDVISSQNLAPEVLINIREDILYQFEK